MKQIIVGSVLALLLSGFFVEQAFAQPNGGTAGNGTNGGIAGNGTNGGIGGNGGAGTIGSTINGKHGTNANGHNGEGATGGANGEQNSD